MELTSDDASTSIGSGPDRTAVVEADWTRPAEMAPGWTKPTVGVDAAAVEAAASGTHAVTAHARMRRRTKALRGVVIQGARRPWRTQRQRGQRAPVIDPSGCS